MASESVQLLGTWRVSSVTACATNTTTLSFNSALTLSTTFVHDFVLLPNVSDYVVSLPNLSNLQVVAVQATQVVRVNFRGTGVTSYISNASAGFQLTQLAMYGSSISGFGGVGFSNSGSDSATVRLILGQ